MLSECWRVQRRWPDGCSAGAGSDGGSAGPLLEVETAEDVSILSEDVQQQIQSQTGDLLHQSHQYIINSSIPAYFEYAHRRERASVRDLPEEGEEQMVSQAPPRHSSRCSSQKVNSFQVSQQHLSILKSILSGTCCIWDTQASNS